MKILYVSDETHKELKIAAVTKGLRLQVVTEKAIKEGLKNEKA